MTPEPWPWPPKPPRWEGPVFAFFYVTMTGVAMLVLYVLGRLATE